MLPELECADPIDPLVPVGCGSVCPSPSTPPAVVSFRVTNLAPPFVKPLVLPALLLALAATARSAAGQSAIDTSLTGPVATVQAQLVEGKLAYARWAKIEDVSADVQRAYGHANWATLWSTAGQVTTAAEQTVRLLGQVDSLGLDPADFDAALLDSLRAQLAAGPASEALLAQFEATLSVSTARLLRALRFGRARQPKAYPKLTRPSADDYDIGAGVYAVSRTADPLPVFDQASPQWAPYRTLLAALPALDRVASDSLLQPGAAVLATRRTAPFHAAPRLRSILGTLGFPTDSAPAATADTLIDASLAKSIRAFQKSAKVPLTGLFDAPTRDKLRAAIRQRQRDTRLTLERWRWLPRRPDGRAIVVNIPEYRLHVYDQVNGPQRPSFSMKVVVGRAAEDRYTPMFVEDMEHVIFSPFWEVPQTIAADEIVPKARKDSTYLARNRYVLVRGYANNAPQVSPDSTTLARVGKSVRVRQLPGDYNSLGRVKFMLPNDLNIYLHDTNEKGFFRRETRALSHGCVRVSEPQRLAEWVLKGDTAWSLDRMKKAMKAEQPELVRLSEHIPVLLVYHTAAVDDAGVVRSFKDVYEYDEELEQLLSRGFGSPR